jgi:hypothetical protein
MMRWCKTLFLMMLLALTLTGPALGQSAPTGEGKVDKSESGASTASTTKANATDPSASTTPASAPSTAGKAGGAAETAKPGGAAETAKPGNESSSGAAPAEKSASAATMDGATYQVRLRDLEQRIDELKEQIRRSHTRLSLLSETILSGGTGGARAEITFINDMSSAFRMTQALFVLDGAVQYNKQDETGLLAGQKEIPIFSGSIPPGDHTLQVLVKLRGHGYGVFSYLQGYRFEIRSSHSFTVTEGKTIELKAIAFEKGDVTTPIEQRPAVRYHKNVRTGMDSGSVPGETKGASSDAKSSVSVSAGSK